MRSLGGIILMAGIGVALILYLPAPVGSGSSFERLQRIAESRSAKPPTVKPLASRLSSFSPSITLATHDQISRRLANFETTAASAPTSPPAQASATHEAQTNWRTTVIPSPASRELNPRDPDARYKLVLEIQQQLRRVGCYWGRVDGSWGYGTKEAMQEFTQRVNATLPLDEPDYVQLSLIQSHGEHACGACPTGQNLSPSGRCVGLPVGGQIAALKHDGGALDSNMEHSPPERQSLFRPVPTTVISTEALPDRMSIGALDSATVDLEQAMLPLAPAAATPSGTAPNVATANPPAIVSQTPTHRTRADYRRGFASDGHRESPGTPRYNLLLGLGGLY